MPDFDILEIENNLDYSSASIKDILLSPDFFRQPAISISPGSRVFLSSIISEPDSSIDLNSDSPLNARFQTTPKLGYPDQHSPSPTNSFPELDASRLPPLFNNDLTKSCSELFPATKKTQLSSSSSSSAAAGNSPSLQQYHLESPVVRRSLGDVTPPYQFFTVSQLQHHTPVRKSTTTTTTRQRKSTMAFSSQSSIGSTDGQQPTTSIIAQSVSDTTPFIDRLRRTTGKLVPASFAPIHHSPSYAFSQKNIQLASPFSTDTSVERRSGSDEHDDSTTNHHPDDFAMTNYKPPNKCQFNFWNSPLTEPESPASSRSTSVAPTEPESEEDSNYHGPPRLGVRNRLDTTCVTIQETTKKLKPDDEISNTEQPKVKKRKIDSTEKSSNNNLKSIQKRITKGKSDVDTTFESIRETPFDLSLFRRTFPPDIPIREDYPSFYRQYPIIPYFFPHGCTTSVLAARTTKRSPPSITNEPRSAYDLYTPRFVKGVGINKVGLCPLCFEPNSRGGNNAIEWLAMKVSAYKYYHLQYVHGISSFTGAPFSPPVEFRITKRRPAEVRKHEKTELLQGRCHKCEKWVAIEGVKIGEVKVKELYW
ncbi:hypothetical protein Clacol_008559 [Clathrus columnatus]|uniref:Transcription regulator Rua1 C-terminal domain-containing protein n=1 Tax=Clathrus columnatus TaxID=1419009 RepID=A0AAV5AIW0_9AGAM|nr:hypothetical protein Clacol_008559 [Clathrus columnatus]